MSNAGNYIKKESESITSQTLSPRDFLNKHYIIRYEDVVETLQISSDASKDDFFNNLNKLYWSFVIPRRYEFSQDELKILDSNVIENKDVEGSLRLLENIAHLMHIMGINKPEFTSLTPGHEFNEDLEDNSVGAVVV